MDVRFKTRTEKSFPTVETFNTSSPKNVAIINHKLMMMIAYDKNSVTETECLQD
jgi:hypothetical protein